MRRIEALLCRFTRGLGVAAIVLCMILLACPDRDDEPDNDTLSDDDVTGDDTASDDDSATVLTTLTTVYGCISEPGDGSARPWYTYDPRSYIEVPEESLAYEEGHAITRSHLTLCDVLWNWDTDADQFPTEPGWFVSGTIDLEVFHGVEQLVVWLPKLVPFEECRCDLEPGAQLQVRGGAEPDSLGDWTMLELEETAGYPDDVCLKSWILEEDEEQPGWAGRYLQFRIDLWSDSEEGYVQAALPLYVTYRTTVPYYYFALNEVLTKP